jgi:hypothetical protein
MQMLEYISAIQRKLVSQYGFKERADAPGIPAQVPDGKYPMEIDGKLDRVVVKNGKIHCCNFD